MISDTANSGLGGTLLGQRLGGARRGEKSGTSCAPRPLSGRSTKLGSLSTRRRARRNASLTVTRPVGSAIVE